MEQGIFISYSSKDKEFAVRLATDLRLMGLKVWIDKWEMRVGDSLNKKIAEGISNSGWFCVVLSPNSVTSPWVQKELNAGLERELEKRDVFILPILLKDCEIPLFLRDKVYADFRNSYEDGFSDFTRRESLRPSFENETFPEHSLHKKISKGKRTNKISIGEKWFAVISGLIFLMAILAIALFLPRREEFRIDVFRIVLALAGGAFAAILSGFLVLEGRFPRSIVRVGGSLAFFVIIFWVNPLALLSPVTSLPVSGPIKPRITARIVNVDDQAKIFVNGKEVVVSYWGKGEGGKPIGHRPGYTNEIDVTDSFRVGENLVRLWLWNGQFPGGVHADYELKINGGIFLTTGFHKEDPTEGVKFDKTYQVFWDGSDRVTLSE